MKWKIQTLIVGCINGFQRERLGSVPESSSLLLLGAGLVLLVTVFVYRDMNRLR